MSTPGRLTGRLLKSLALSRGSFEGAAAYAAAQRWTDGDRIVDLCEKAAMPAMGPDTQASIFTPVGQDVAPLLAQASVVGRLSASMRRVPPLTNLVTTTAGAIAYWDDAAQSGGSAIPPSALAFSRFNGLTPRLVRALTVITNELARISDAETTLVNDLVRALARAIDIAFLNPYSSGSPSTAPASITSSGRIFSATGGAVTVDSIDSDLEKLIVALVDAGGNLLNATFVMNPISAARLSRLRGTSGAPAHPGMSVTGGTLLGLPAIATSHVTRGGSPSPGASYISLLDPTQVWLTSGDEVVISASRGATVEMTDAPTNDSSSATASQQVSMFQTESIAIKLVRRIGWQPVTGQLASATLVGVEW